MLKISYVWYLRTTYMDTVPVSNICVCTLNTYDGFILCKLYTSFENVDVYLQKVCDSNVYLPVCVCVPVLLKWVCYVWSIIKRTQTTSIMSCFPHTLLCFRFGSLGCARGSISQIECVTTQPWCLGWEKCTESQGQGLRFADIICLCYEILICWNVLLWYVMMCSDSDSVHIHVDNTD